MVPVRLSHPTLSRPLTPCSVNNDFAWLCNDWDHLLHCTCASWRTHLVTDCFVQFAYMSFAMKALAAAALGLHWSDIIVIWGYVMATLWLCYVMAAALAAASARGETVCQERLSCASQERLNVSTFPTAHQVFFQPTSLHLAYPGFSKQCEQQDNWYHEQDQLYNWCSWQDIQQIGEWGSSLRERKKQPIRCPAVYLEVLEWAALKSELEWDPASLVVTSWRDSHPSFERDTLSSSVPSSLKRAGKMAE